TATYATVTISRLASSDATIALRPPASSADTYAASFQPPYVSRTKTIANPNIPGAGVLANAARVPSGVVTAKPATATMTRPRISIVVSTFCVRADPRRPAILIAASKTTIVAAHATLLKLAANGATRAM